MFDRYGLEFATARYQEILPDGVARGGLTPVEWDPGQLTIEFDVKDPIAGYDPDEFVQLTLVGRGQDPKDDRCYRSHLGRIVTKRLDKIICLPCIKDHHAAGATGALKNMSHGLVNNVFRSHSSPQSIAMVAFIPTVVNHPIIRKKCVLHIMDGSRGVWEGGPFGKNPEWIWDYNALLLATDPVAMDHIEWDILDAKRKADGGARRGRRRAPGGRPVWSRGVRHPAAPIHRDRRPGRTGDLRFQVPERPAVLDRSPRREYCLIGGWALSGARAISHHIWSVFANNWTYPLFAAGRPGAHRD